MCLLFLKLKQTKNMPNIFKSFLFQNSEMHILKGHPIFYIFYVLALETIHRGTTVLLISIFENAWKERY